MVSEILAAVKTGQIIVSKYIGWSDNKELKDVVREDVEDLYEEIQSIQSDIEREFVGTAYELAYSGTIQINESTLSTSVRYTIIEGHQQQFGARELRAVLDFYNKIELLRDKLDQEQYTIDSQNYYQFVFDLEEEKQSAIEALS